MWPNPQETADLVTFTEKILNGKLHFCAVIFCIQTYNFLVHCSCVMYVICSSFIRIYNFIKFLVLQEYSVPHCMR